LIINLSHKVVHLQFTIDEKINLKTGFILTFIINLRTNEASDFTV